eukprot:scaffold113411_cov67-Phaeocystis_antarctica.AAC.3
MEVTSWTHADHTVNLSYFDPDLEWGWPDVHHPAGMIWKEVGPNRPASGSEIVDAALVEVLSEKLDELRNRTGKPEKTVSLDYETSEPAKLRSYEVRLNSSDLNTTGFLGGVMRGNFINVSGTYLTVVDPLPCAEFGAQSPASG